MTLDDLTEPLESFPQHVLAPLDREDAEPRNEMEQHWVDHGWVHLKQFIQEPKLLDRYMDAWIRDNDVRSGYSRWPECAYMHAHEVLDLCLLLDLVQPLEHLVGGDVGLHLVLSNWRSTTRDWHQDDYLNPDFVHSWYAACWIALEDISPDSGPFQLVDGSHKWPRIRRNKILPALHLKESDPMWPPKTEAVLTPLVEQEIVKRKATVITPEIKRGDVLIWHGCLYHRGSIPKDPTLERRAVIAHYSAVHRRPDMHVWDKYGRGHYFVNPQPLKEL